MVRLPTYLLIGKMDDTTKYQLLQACPSSILFPLSSFPFPCQARPALSCNTAILGIYIAK